MIVLKKEIFDLIRREMTYLGLIFLLALIIFKIAFFKSDFAVLLRNVASLFWLFALPGYFIMLYWEEKLDFMERFVIGIALSAGIIGISGYYLGLIGLNIRYHTILLPLMIAIAGFVIAIKKEQD